MNLIPFAVGLCLHSTQPKTVRAFLKISVGMQKRGGKWAQLKSYKLGAKTMCKEDCYKRHKLEERGQRVLSISSAAVCSPLALGIRLLLTRATACSSQAVYDTSHPVTWLSATEKACVPFFVSGSGHTCRDRCPIWQGASKFQRSRGLDAQCLGNSFPLSFPSYPASHLHGPKGIL